MPTTEQLRERLIDKLKELFQLDQPDLDFGFYRIMHAKAEQVSQFLEKDLLKIVENAFGKLDDGQKVKLQAEYEKAIEQAKEFGATSPEETAPVKKAKAALEGLKDNVSVEGEVYDHLNRFFERYYHEGDFITRRYFARETSGKAAPFAIPYNGEEVMLHWANADQYYIKTTENFNNFTVDLRAAKELQAQNGGLLPSGENKPLRLHFRIVEATEGEHGNIKETDKRFFIIYKERPVEFNESGELVINFEFRPDPEKGSKQEGTWREHRNTEAVNVVQKVLDDLEGAVAYKSALKTKAPTDKDSNRPLLAKYVNQYTASNTYDYFIHKDLAGFLRRELDFYIKNEVMRLDDVENADVPTVESYLSKIKVFRSIAHKLIDFLAQLEEFQKKLWLKKKFVVETNCCITLDRVPEELYSDIVSNESQRKEWVRLFAINEINGDLHARAFSEPLTVEFLKANPYLILDTKFFSDHFRSKLVASIENFDDNCDGLLVHSENFQALNILKERYRKEVRATYIDPPYNTVHSEIVYKNQYKHSSWLSLVANTANITPFFWRDTFSFGIAIDDYEFVNLTSMLDTLFPNLERSIVIVNHHPQGAGGRLSRTHEYFIIYSPKDAPSLMGEPKGDYQEDRSFMRSGTAENNYRKGRWKSFYALLYDTETRNIIGAEPPVPLSDEYPVVNTEVGYQRIYPINSRGEERVWRSSYETGKKRAESGELVLSNGGAVYQTIDHEGKRETLFSNWTDSKYNAGIHGSNLLSNMGLGGIFDYPKSIFTLETALWAQTYGDDNALVLDYFGGSGTTGHAVINLNRKDEGNRKYILVEMGDYFEKATKPRIQKAVYSAAWLDGKPENRNTGISHCFKYLRLESYEDALNNLTFDHNPMRDRALSGNPELREDYMLRYMLDMECRGSQALLNIDAFADPTTYTLKVKKPGSDEYTVRNVDLLETFNYLVGLRVNHIAAPQSFTAKFTREKDPELPEDQNTRLVIDGRIKQEDTGAWWFRKVEGWLPADRNNPNNGQKAKLLIVWRKLTGDMERDNLMLDEWFKTIRINPQDFEFDTIYVNGSNNLPNLKLEGENWKVRLIEEDFMRLMWDVENI